MESLKDGIRTFEEEETIESSFKLHKKTHSLRLKIESIKLAIIAITKPKPSLLMIEFHKIAMKGSFRMDDPPLKLY